MVTNDPKPSPLRIRLPYASEQEFATRYGSNVGRAGIFIATRTPKPEGTALSFELVLQDGARLIRGEGLVVKVRAPISGAPAGMMVRFRRLDARSKALLDRVCAGRPGSDAPTPAAQAKSAPRSRLDLNAAAQTAPEPKAEIDIALGVELGPFLTRAAWTRSGAPAPLVLGPRGEMFVPSAAAWDEHGALHVGWAALAFATPFWGWVRGLGLEAHTPLAQALFADAPHPMVADARGEVAFKVGDNLVSATELCAALLRTLSDASQRLVEGAAPRAVICAPPDWSQRQRQALWRAAQDAGLGPVRLLQPTCGTALALGHGQSFARRRLLVCDIGSSRVETSVIALTGNDLEQVSAAADAHAPPADVDVALTDVARGQPLDVALANAALAPHAALLASRCATLARRALEAATLTPAALDEVVCVGALAHLPGFSDVLKVELGHAPRLLSAPHEVPAYGAALLGLSLLDERPDMVTTHVSEVLSAPIDIRWTGEARLRLFERGTRLPAQKSLALTATQHELTLLQVTGNTAPAYLGMVLLQAAQVRERSLRFHLSPDGLLTVALESGGSIEPLELSRLTEFPTPEPLAPAPAPPAKSGGLLEGFRRLLRRSKNSNL